MEAPVGELEAALGHKFRVPELLERALTHRSFAKELAVKEPELTFGAMGDNERLEFLGDAVLGLVVAEALFGVHPDWDEGELTRVRAKLVSRQYMAQVAQAISLGKYLRLSRGEDKSGLRRKATVLSNSMEAIIGAMFLDAGLQPVRAFARRQILAEAADQLAEELRSGAALGNYKSALQELLQAEHAGTPVYRVKSESGPGHRKRFLVELRLKMVAGEPGKSLASGMGTTKKLAEQDAARRALERLTKEAAQKSDPAEPDSKGEQEEETAP